MAKEGGTQRSPECIDIAKRKKHHAEATYDDQPAFRASFGKVMFGDECFRGRRSLVLNIHGFLLIIPGHCELYELGT